MLKLIFYVTLFSSDFYPLSIYSYRIVRMLNFCEAQDKTLPGGYQ